MTTADDGLDAPLTPEEEAELARRAPVEDALDAAWDAAGKAGEKHLEACLAALSLLWDLGEPGIERAAAILGREAAAIRAILAKPCEECGRVEGK